MIPFEWVDDCIEDKRKAEGREIIPLDNDRVVMGVDVESNSGIILLRRGCSIESIREFPYTDTEQLADWVIRIALDEEPYAIMIDGLGVGYGLTAKLNKRCSSDIIEVIVNHAANESETYYQLRDELWWRVREKFERRAYSIPNDDDLIAQLTTIKYDIIENTGKIKIESKKKLHREGKSPHKADALCLTEYFEDELIRNYKTQRVNWREKIYSDWRIG